MNREFRIASRRVVLPDGTVGGFERGEGALQFNLAFRNLVRSRMLRLASGQ